MEKDTLVLKYEGIDEWSRPIFKDENNKRYGSVCNLMPYGVTKEEVLERVTPFDLCYFGNTFNCEPHGGAIPEHYKTIKLI